MLKRFDCLFKIGFREDFGAEIRKLTFHFCNGRHHALDRLVSLVVVGNSVKILRDKDRKRLASSVRCLQSRNYVVDGLFGVFSSCQEASSFIACRIFENLKEFVLCCINLFGRVEVETRSGDCFIRCIVYSVLHVIEDFVDEYRCCHDLFSSKLVGRGEYNRGDIGDRGDRGDRGDI